MKTESGHLELAEWIHDNYDYSVEDSHDLALDYYEDSEQNLELAKADFIETELMVRELMELI